MKHPTRNRGSENDDGDCASALRLLEQLDRKPAAHRGVRRGAALRADRYRLAGLQHAVAVAFLYRLACRTDVPWPDARQPEASSATAPCAALTPREADVMHWLSRGKTDAEIAALLAISPRTVHKHLEHVYVKLGVETRTAAAMRTLALGPA